MTFCRDDDLLLVTCPEVQQIAFHRESVRRCTADADIRQVAPRPRWRKFGPAASAETLHPCFKRAKVLDHVKCRRAEGLVEFVLRPGTANGNAIIDLPIQ